MIEKERRQSIDSKEERMLKPHDGFFHKAHRGDDRKLQRRFGNHDCAICGRSDAAISGEIILETESRHVIVSPLSRKDYGVSNSVLARWRGIGSRLMTAMKSKEISVGGYCGVPAIK